MGFLAPWFLAGVAAVGLPIWIHLLKRHKTDPHLFPSLMLFEKREVSSVKHRRLEYLLLFALRVAMLILLALLFANPFIRRAVSASEGKKLTVVAVDHSFSMRAGDRLARAKDEALSVIANVKPGEQAQVIALGGQVQTLTQPTADTAELRAAVSSIEPGDSRASFGELARYARTLSESVKLPIELHLASDLQKSAMPPGFADLRLNPGTSLVLHQVGKPATNWTVENVIAPRRVYDPKKVRIQATVANFAGGEPPQTPHAAQWKWPGVVYAADQAHDTRVVQKRVVSLMLNGKVLQTKTVDVPENGRAQVEFLGLEAPYGFSRGEVRIDAADVLPADDRFPFSVERMDPRKVLFIDDGRGGNALLYFRAALDASPDAAFQLEALHAEQAANLPLSNFAFVVLSNLGSLPPGFEDSLKRYVGAGGSVLVVLGAASAALQRVPVLDEPIQTSSYAGREGERFLTIADVDVGHPALRSVERFTGVKFYQAIRVAPAKSRVLAKLSNDTPLVLERQIGEGKTLVFASTFDNIANDLPLHASWVPFVQQTAAYLGGGGAEQPANMTVDAYVELRAADSKGAAEVLGPDGKRLLSLEEAATAKNFAVRNEGFFELKAANGRHSLLAVHADRRESDLALMPKETLDLWKATGQSDQTVQGASTLGDQIDKRPWGLWPILLLLLLGVAVAESVVADRYLRPPSEDQRKEAA